jgi:hypothetical protein
MPLTGDFGKLARWTRKFGDLSDSRAAFEIADGMAEAALGLVAEGFSREADPFGNRWAPKKRDDGRRILRGETNRLIQFRKQFVNQHGFRVTSLAPYARYHQSGTRRMVARPMVPRGNRLPAKWSSEFRGVFIARMHALLR